MDYQAAAEREKRQKVKSAEADKQATVLAAEAQRQRDTNESEGARTRLINEAEGYARKVVLQAEAEKTRLVWAIETRWQADPLHISSKVLNYIEVFVFPCLITHLHSRACSCPKPKVELARPCWTQRRLPTRSS
jgi:hypothetical protein